MTNSHRDQEGLPLLDTVVKDVRYACRKIVKSPGFSAVAILSVAIGVAANTAIFSVINSVLLRPLAYNEPDRLFMVGELTAGEGVNLANPAHAREWASQCPSLEHLALIRSGPVQVSSGADPASIAGARVSPNLFTLLGVQPIVGRTFLPTEEQAGHDQVVLLAESLWRTRFNADPSLVGTSILIDRTPHQVIGIMPESFRIPSSLEDELFRPLVIGADELSRLIGNHNYFAVARLRRGVTPEQALAEINVVQARFPRRPGASVELRARLTPLQDFITEDARTGLLMLAAAVGAVLLIVCVNLANLLLSRMASRGREAAVRTALGASRARQIAQVLTESLLLAACGGVLAIVFAQWLVRFLVVTSAVDIPRLDEVRVDTSVLLFALALTIFVGLLFGMLPAWRFTRHDPQALLSAGRGTSEGRAGLRLREMLITLEVGMSAALLIVAGLLTSSLTRLLNVEKGFDMDRVATVEIDLMGSQYAEPVNRERFYDRLLGNIGAIPGVEAAGVITHLPIRGETWMDSIYLQGATGEGRHVVNNRYTSPGYFRALNIALVDGRMFDEHDRTRRVAVLSTKAAKLLWPAESNPLGRVFVAEDNQPVTLVGIVTEVRASLQTNPPPMAYYPYWQRAPAEAALVIRTTADPTATAGAIRAALRNEDAQLPIPAVRTMQEVVDNSLTERRFQLTLMGVFAVCALLVANLGIYGVVSYAVARRRSEFGIRMALGAQRAGLLGLVMRQGMMPVVIGLAAGIAAALFLGRAIRGLLFEVQPTDPLTIAGVCAVLLLIGALACLIPARRISGADAIAALRAE